MLSCRNSALESRNADVLEWALLRNRQCLLANPCGNTVSWSQCCIVRASEEELQVCFSKVQEGKWFWGAGVNFSGMTFELDLVSEWKYVTEKNGGNINRQKVQQIRWHEYQGIRCIDSEENKSSMIGMSVEEVEGGREIWKMPRALQRAWNLSLVLKKDS